MSEFRARGQLVTLPQHHTRTSANMSTRTYARAITRCRVRPLSRLTSVLVKRVVVTQYVLRAEEAIRPLHFGAR